MEGFKQHPAGSTHPAQHASRPDQRCTRTPTLIIHVARGEWEPIVIAVDTGRTLETSEIGWESTAAAVRARSRRRYELA